MAADHDRFPRRGRPQKPPNYASRVVQFRLFMLVASLVLVVILMFEARRPENWSWMGFQKPNMTTAAAPEDPARSAQLDTQRKTGRTREPQDRQMDSQSQEGQTRQPGADRLGELAESGEPAEVSTEPGSRKASQLAAASELLSRTLDDFWSQQYLELRPAERQLLFVGLERGSLQQTWQLDRQAWDELVEQLQVARGAYEAEILRAVSDLAPTDEPQRQLWMNLLRDLQKIWQRRRAALLRLPQASTDAEAETLAELLTLLDRIALAQVKDDAIGARLVEREAWFGQFRRLRSGEFLWAAAQDRVAEDQTGDEQTGEMRMPQAAGRGTSDRADSLAEETLPSFVRVNYLQLFEQPDAYRGRPVRIEGTVWRVEFQPASPNPYDIEGYHVFWIRPEGRANAPYVVYARELPEGFPRGEIDEPRNFAGGEAEPVIVRGLFFKRWAYEAQEELRLAPLILAETVDWRPQASQKPDRERPTWMRIVTWVLVAILGGTLCVRWAIRAADRAAVPRGFPSVRQEASPSGDEVRATMEQQDQGPMLFRTGESGQDERSSDV